VNIAYAKVSLSFLQALVRAIGCNWLVCLAVWMAFVALGFEHSVAKWG